jgi:hypothetical protein
MSDVRCRACGAAVPAEAQWCSLCFADLREPAPVRERVSVPAAASEGEIAETNSAAAAPLADVRPDPKTLLDVPRRTPAPDPAGEPDSAAADETDKVEEAKWPCLRCGEQVPISLDACTACCAGFLAGSTTAPSVRLPVVGDIGRLSRSQRLTVGLIISLCVMIVLILLATIGGHVF